MTELGENKISMMAMKLAGLLPPQPPEVEALLIEALEDSTSKDYADAVAYNKQMQKAGKGG